MSTPVLRPHLSEKAYAQSEQNNTYVFLVPEGVNADLISRAVAKQYDVKVNSVRLATKPARSVRSYRQRGRFVNSRKSAAKKAYVTLEAGHKLPLFASASDDKKKSATKAAKK